MPSLSDRWLIVIPTDPFFVPDWEAAARARGLLAAFAPPSDAGLEASSVFWDRVEFVDCGSNFETVRCPSCSADLTLGWWQDQLDIAAASSFDRLNVQTPCCDTATSLNDLIYEWPQGFASWQLEVLNPLIGLLPDAELNEIARAVNHDVRAIYVRV